MSGDTLVQIVTIVVGGIVTLTTIWVRADVKALKAEIEQLRQTVASAHGLILQQNTLISSLTEALSVLQTANAQYNKKPPLS